MKPTLPMEPNPFAVRGYGEARCRRYLFDRPYGEDACGKDVRPPAGDAPASVRAAPNPAPMGRDDAPERRR